LDTNDHGADAPASDRLVDDLRRDILSGAFPPESRLIEETLARERGLSRTPVRHALRALELEGLLHRLPRRGYRVRSFTIDEINDAIEVRGELEAMAARIHAERGWLKDTRQRLIALNQEAVALAAGGLRSDGSRLRWAEINMRFHDALVHGTGNIGLVTAYEQLKRIPLVSPRAMVFERDDGVLSERQVAAAQADHDRAIEAIERRKGLRASEIMRDHAIRSSDTKRKNVSALLANELLVGDLGAALVTSR
jgi:GntR family transcriptional regulator, vanillate catabolism transcriptional regulator